MSRVIHIEVTADDIALGLRKRACECPIARAAQRAYPDLGKLGVFARGRGLSFGLGTYDSVDDQTLPPEATEFVHRFDNGEPVEPFAFDLELP